MRRRIERRRKGRFIRWMFWLCVLSSLSFFLWYRHATLSPINASNTNEIIISIEPGSSITSIANILQKNNLLSSTFAFNIYTKINRSYPSMKAGQHAISPSQNMVEIVKILQSNPTQEQIVITIPEGFTAEQIDELLVRKNLAEPGALVECIKTCSGDIFPYTDSSIKNLEGFLYPDTYFVSSNNFSVESFVERLIQQFNTKTTSLQQEAENSGRTWNEIMTMASMIEREAFSEQEKPIIAGVLWKRLDIGMLLGVDATVRYILNKWNAPLTYKDLQYDSAYNTRLYGGMPPGPIANPSISSIEAALNPTQTEYLYYLHDANGQIHYGRTLDEHNTNKARYIN